MVGREGNPFYFRSQFLIVGMLAENVIKSSSHKQSLPDRRRVFFSVSGLSFPWDNLSGFIFSYTRNIACFIWIDCSLSGWW